MMDEFLREAKIDWRGQKTDLAGVRQRLRRSRHVPHILLGLEILGAATVFLVGLWFAWMALTTRDLLFILSAAVMLVAMPAFTILSIVARRSSMRWEDETPASLLRVGLRRADASLGGIRVGRLGVAVILAFVGALWVLESAGLIHAQDFLILYSWASAVICGPYLLYLGWRKGRVMVERAVCQRLLGNLIEPQSDMGE